MNFSEVLGRAWKIIWKFKVLWIFGILSSCGSGGGGGGGGGRGNFNLPSDASQAGANPFPELERFFQDLGNQISRIPVWVYVVGILVLLALAILVYLLGVVGRTGLTRGAWLADEGAQTLSFGQIWGEILPYFWRVVLLDLLAFVVFIIIGGMLVAGVFLVAVPTQGMGVLCLVPLICVLVPVFWLIGVLLNQSLLAIVGENLGVFAALGRAWGLIRANLGTMILMSLILGILSGVIGIVLSLPMIVIAVPFLGGVISGITTQNQNLVTGGIGIAVVLFCLYLPVLYLLQGILQSYTQSAWTLTFRRLTGRSAGPVQTPAAGVE